LAFAKAGTGDIIVVSPLGAMPSRSRTSLGKFGLSLLGGGIVGQADVRS
jgi:hypothetical protein